MRLSHRPQGFGESWGLMPTQHAVTFLDNHDTQVHYFILLFAALFLLWHRPRRSTNDMRGNGY